MSSVLTLSVRLQPTDDEMVHILRPGRQRVRAGEYRIEVGNDEVRLEFSTGETFRIEKGQVLKIEVKGFPVE